MSIAQQQPIGVFDSGIGGLSVANAISGRLPRESLVYFADTAHVPYGPRPVEEIREFSFQITRFLLEQNCKLIVLACNTATAAALSHLRAAWPEIPFVGMEPAVKPAAEATRSGKVGVLATASTIRSERYADLMSRFAAEVTVYENPCIGLVPQIENGALQAPATRTMLQDILDPMLENGIDTLVLGCTHYPFIRPLIEDVVGDSVRIIDPAPAVARQVERLLTEHDLLNASTAAPAHRFYASGPLPELKLFTSLDFELTNR